MLFKSLNRTDPERVFVVFQAIAAISANDTLQMDITTDVDGVRAGAPTAAGLFCFLGVADAAVASGDYGLAQVYGYRSSSKVLGTDTSLAAGLPLIPVAAQAYFSTINSTTSRMQPSFAYLVQSTTTLAGNASPKIFIRAL